MSCTNPANPKLPVALLSSVKTSQEDYKMATKKIHVVIIILILASLACSSGTGGPNIQETVDAAIQATQQEGTDGITETPSQPLDTPVTVTPQAESQTLPNVDAELPCDKDKWRIVPVARWDQPGTAGLKNVLVQLAIQNNTSQWGEAAFLGIYQSPIIATTEGGFTYPANFYSGGMLVGGQLEVTPRIVPPG
jgi:hypothetical protein